MFKKSLLLIILYILLISQCLAYGGIITIPQNNDAVVRKHAEAAIIAWNGEEEVLIVSSVLSSTSPTTAIEIMPLPCKPETVEIGDANAFKQAGKLVINKTGYETGLFGTDPVQTGLLREYLNPLFQDAPDIGYCSFEADNLYDFYNMLNIILSQHNLDNIKPAEYLNNEINGNFKEGITNFVVDIIQLDQFRRKTPVLIYKFKSKKTYYPFWEIQAPKDQDYYDDQLIPFSEHPVKKIRHLSNIFIFYITDKPANITHLELENDDEKNELYDYYHRGNFLLRKMKVKGINKHIDTMFDGATINFSNYSLYPSKEGVKDLESGQKKDPWYYPHLPGYAFAIICFFLLLIFLPIGGILLFNLIAVHAPSWVKKAVEITFLVLFVLLVLYIIHIHDPDIVYYIFISALVCSIIITSIIVKTLLKKGDADET